MIVRWRTQFPRYTNSTKVALYYAILEAKWRNSTWVSVDDLVAGLTHNKHVEDCPFRPLQDNSSEIRKKMDRAPLPEDWLTQVKLRPGKPKWNSDVRRVLRAASRRAKQFWIDTDHLQFAVLKEGGIGAAALNDLGFTPEKTDQLGAEGRLKYPPKQPTFITRLMQYKPAIPWLCFFAGFVAVILYLRLQN
jgi:hypothetical protein